MADREARALAMASGAAQRVYKGVSDLARITSALPNPIAVQGNAVLEELDLLRFFLREATLRGVIEPAAPPTPPTPLKPRSKLRAPASGKAKGGYARAAKLSPATRKAIAKKAAKARWSR